MAVRVPQPLRTASAETSSISFDVETDLCLDPFLNFGDDDVFDHLLQAFVDSRHELLFLLLNHLLDSADLLLSFLGLCGQTISRFVHLGDKRD